MVLEVEVRDQQNSFGERKSELSSPKATSLAFPKSFYGALSLNYTSDIKQSWREKCWILYIHVQALNFSIIHYNLLQCAKNYSSPIAIKITEPKLGWGRKLQQTQATKIEQEQNNSVCPVSPMGIEQRHWQSAAFLMLVQKEVHLLLN